MTTLHIIRQSAFTTTDFSHCLQVAGNNDVIVFIDDGCYNLNHNSINVVDSKKNIQLKVIKHHADARAISIDNEIFTAIDMTDLVSLTFSNNRVITWQ